MILLFNWAPDSNEVGGGFAEAAGEALFVALMKGWVRTDNSRASFVEAPLHFIGHSRGAVANSAAIRRLGALGIEVEQVASLDPIRQSEWSATSTKTECSPSALGQTLNLQIIITDKMEHTKQMETLTASRSMALLIADSKKRFSDH